MHKRAITELIPLGESATLEFKSTLQWDILENRQNKELRQSILKTIAAFLNSAGGTLIIGVEDNGAIYGLSRDLNLVKNKNLDGFEQLLMELITKYLGPEFARFIQVRFERMNGEYVCVLDVDKSAEPVFLNEERGREFYVRLGNTSRTLDAEEAHRYIQMSWE
jgi:predicted HTH transcriptional regulator